MSKEIIEQLNILLGNEITSISQYILHSQIFIHLGYNKLAKKYKNEIPDELGHANQLAKRILFLKGVPKITQINVDTENNPEEIIKSDLKLEEKGIEDLKKAINLVDNTKDYITSNILQDILASEEEHKDWLSQQLQLISSIGIGSYLQNQL